MSGWNTILTKTKPAIDCFPLISVQKHDAVIKICGIMEKRVVLHRIKVLQLLETGTEKICAQKNSGMRTDAICIFVDTLAAVSSQTRPNPREF